VLAFAGGYIGLPRVLGIGSAVEEFLAPVFADTTIVHAAGEATVEWLLIALSIVAVAAGILAAYWIYVRNWGLAGRMTQRARRLYDLAFAGYYADRAYMEGIVQPLRALGDALAGAVEERTIDRAVNGVAELVGLAGEGLRRLQTGLVRNYALAMLLGVVAVLAYFVLRGVLSW
jgi:NADH-quinone oxidoreductase subunit L